MGERIIEIIRFFFKENFSQKRLSVILVSILITVLFFFTCHNHKWFVDLKKDYGNYAVITSLFICFLVTFIICELICNKFSANKQKATQMINELERKVKRAEIIFDTLNRLTDWQMGFLIKNVLQGKSQIKKYEIGGYEAIWGPEVDALRAKGIITYISLGNYEINPVYYDYINKYYDPKEQTLRFPEISEIERESI